MSEDFCAKSRRDSTNGADDVPNMAPLVHRVLATIGLVLLYVTMTLQLYVAIREYSLTRVPTGIISTALLVVPVVVVNGVSAGLSLRRKRDDQDVNRTIVISLHIAQVGLVSRCLAIYKRCTSVELREFCTLHLAHVGLSCVPAAIVESYILKSSNSFAFPSFLLNLLTLVLVSLALVHTDLVVTDMNFSHGGCHGTHARIIVNTLGVASLILSRSLSIVMFYEVQKYWLFCILSVHLVVFFLGLSILTHCTQPPILWKTCKNVCVSYVNVMEAFQFTNKRGKCPTVLFYVVVLIENTIMSAIWMLGTDNSSSLKLTLVMVTLSTYVFGLVAKYAIFDRDGEDSSDLIKALDITKTYDPQKTYDDVFVTKNKLNGALYIPRGIRVNGETTPNENDKTYNNLAFEAYEDGADYVHRKNSAEIKGRGSEVLKHNTSDRSNAKTLMKRKNAKADDSLSNTSRNTNTLNMSGVDEPPRCHTCSKFLPGEYPMCQLPDDNEPGISDRRRKPSLYKNSDNIVSGAYIPNNNVRTDIPTRVKNVREHNSKVEKCARLFPYSDISLDSRSSGDSSSFTNNRNGLTNNWNSAVTDDTISNFTYTNYSSSSASDARRYQPRMEHRSCRLPDEKISADDRISAWFKHSQAYFESEGSVQSSTSVKIHVNKTHNTDNSAGASNIVDYSISGDDRICSSPGHDAYSAIVNAEKNSDELNAQNLLNNFSLYCKDNRFLGRSSSISSLKSTTSSSLSGRRHREKQKMPYRDALDEYYRKSTLPYHISNRWPIRFEGTNSTYNAVRQFSQNIVDASAPSVNAPSFQTSSTHANQHIESIV